MICAIYYAIWIYVLPYFGQYRIRQELVVLDDESAKVHRLVKVPLVELETWDAEHDVLGQRIVSLQGSGIPRDIDESAETPEKKDV